MWAFHAEENGDASTEATLVLQTRPRYWRMIDCSGARRPEICEARLVKLKDLEGPGTGATLIVYIPHALAWAVRRQFV